MIINYRILPIKPIYIGALLVIFICFTKNICAQVEEGNPKQERNFRSRLYFGGGFGLQFGNVTLIELSPLIGYKITPKLSAGVSTTYKYFSYRVNYSQSIVKTNIYGGGLFARYMLFEGVFAHTEYESLFYSYKSPGSQSYLQKYTSIFVGGGYQQSLGGNSGMYIMALWNLMDNFDSPYSNPVIRVGFIAGF